MTTILICSLLLNLIFAVNLGMDAWERWSNERNQ